MDLLLIETGQRDVSEENITVPPLGLAYIAAVLRNAGHEIDVYTQDKDHYSEEHLTNYIDNNEFDMIGLSVIGGYYQYRIVA